MLQDSLIKKLLEVNRNVSGFVGLSTYFVIHEVFSVTQNRKTPALLR